MGNNVSKEYICDACKKENHDKCESKLRCDCKCNIGGVADVTQKVLTTAGGVGAAVGGLALTIVTGGLAIPIGGALMGAGISSAYQGIEKSIKKERINVIEYCADVGFGAVTGVFTGGVGAAGEAVVANVAKQGAKELVKEGGKKLAIRAGTGAIAGLTSKAIDEVKQCSTTEKKWSDYGKTLDKSGNTTTGGTIASWTTSAIAGSFGGAATHISSSISNSVSTGLQKATVRVAISGATAAGTDALSQGINIAAGNQDEYDLKRTVISGTVSATTTAAMESVKNSIYAFNGGKEKFVENNTNKKIIQEEIPESDRKNAMKAYEELKNIPKSELNKELQKAYKLTELNTKKVYLTNEKSKIEYNFDAKIKRQVQLKNDAIRAGNEKKISIHENKANALIDKRNTAVSNFNRAINKNIQTINKVDPQLIGNSNTHALVGDKVGQIAVDVKDSSDLNRGPKRIIFDCDKTSIKYSDYTDTHDYKHTKVPGDTEFSKHHCKLETNLNIVEKAVDYQQKSVIQNAALNDNECDSDHE